MTRAYISGENCGDGGVAEQQFVAMADLTRNNGAMLMSLTGMVTHGAAHIVVLTNLGRYSIGWRCRSPRLRDYTWRVQTSNPSTPYSPGLGRGRGDEYSRTQFLEGTNVPVAIGEADSDR